MQKIYNSLVRLICLTIMLVSATSSIYSQSNTISEVLIYNDDTDEPVQGIGALYDGINILRSSLPEDYYLVVEGSGDESVEIFLDDDDRKDSSRPYKMDISLSPGSHTLDVYSYSKNSAKGDLLDQFNITFTVEADPTISAIVLYDDDTDEPIAGIDPLFDGMVINENLLPDNYYIVVEGNGDESVEIFLNDDDRKDSSRPYKMDVELPTGSYNLTVQSFSENSANGDLLDEESLSFTVVAEAIECGTITGYQLVNSNTGEVVGPINDGDELVQTSFPSSFHIEVQVDGFVESMLIDVSGDSQVQNGAPFDWFGGDAQLGTYQINTTLYVDDNACGETCGSGSITFSVVEAVCEYESEINPDVTYEPFDSEGCTSNTSDDYQLWIAGFGRATTIGQTTYEENSVDGTAHYAGTFQLGDDVITVDVTYSGATTTAPGAEKEHSCDSYDTAGWKYYPEVCGTLVSQNSGTYTITRKGPAFQLGNGANSTSLSGDQLGASSWFYLSNGYYCAPYSEGDFNFNLVQNTNCCDVELSCSDDIFVPCDFGGEAVVSWDEPTVTSSCGNTVELVQLSGPVSGSEFPVGITTITYGVEGCDEVTCSFDVEVEDCTAILCDNFTASYDIFGNVQLSSNAFSGFAQISIFDTLNGTLLAQGTVEFDRDEASFPFTGPQGLYIATVTQGEIQCSSQFAITGGIE